jgi:hypothetical protein
MHRAEEIDPCNVPLPESDDKVSCVGDVVDHKEEKKIDEDADKDVLPSSVAGMDNVPEIAKVCKQNLSPTFPDS